MRGHFTTPNLQTDFGQEQFFQKWTNTQGKWLNHLTHHSNEN